VGLDLDLFGQPFVVLAQDGDDFVTAEVIGQLAAFGEHLAQHGAGQQDAVFFVVRAGSQGSHAVALVAVEGPVDLQRLAEQGLAGLFGVGILSKMVWASNMP
jgi:hypothetical protein